MDRRVYYVWDNRDYTKPITIPEEVVGTPIKGHHFTSSPVDNLVELSGRVCYDSCATPKSRNSADYHKHIIEVDHGSVQEHAVFVFQDDIDHVHIPTIEIIELMVDLVNRPGLHAALVDNHKLRLAINVRAIREWGKWSRHTSKWLSEASGHIGNMLCELTKPFAPLLFQDKTAAAIPEDMKKNFCLTAPESEDEIWCSLLFTGVSRGYSHEQVRHKFTTAVSQRSTRYVDEDASPWIWHPLIRDDEYSTVLANTIKAQAQANYTLVKAHLQKKLVDQGIDKFTARKQARGAARGILGNALGTELVFSASLKQWRHMLSMRANPAADDEIHEVFEEVRTILNQTFPDRKF